MTDKLLVLCDVEEEYAQLMTEFLRGHKDLPWQIHTYTDPTGLMQQEKNLAYETMTNTAKLYGYESVEDAEKRMW